MPLCKFIIMQNILPRMACLKMVCLLLLIAIVIVLFVLRVNWIRDRMMLRIKVLVPLLVTILVLLTLVIVLMRMIFRSRRRALLFVMNHLMRRMVKWNRRIRKAILLVRVVLLFWKRPFGEVLSRVRRLVTRFLPLKSFPQNFMIRNIVLLLILIGVLGRRRRYGFRITFTLFLLITRKKGRLFRIGKYFRVNVLVLRCGTMDRRALQFTTFGLHHGLRQRNSINPEDKHIPPL